MPVGKASTSISVGGEGKRVNGWRTKKKEISIFCHFYNLYKKNFLLRPYIYISNRKFCCIKIFFKMPLSAPFCSR